MNTARRTPVSSVTILICTYNRAPLLRETLAAMQEMTQPDGCAVDILVVDNNSTDNTAAVVTHASRHSRFPITLLQERRQGKSFALNTGLALAAGDVLALTDDDVLPAIDWLVRLVDDFRTQNVTFVFGKVLPRWSATPPPELLTPPAQAIWGPLAILDYGDDPQQYRVDSTGQRLPIGANLAFMRSALVAIGGWRTDLGKVNNTLISGEDHEIFMRIRRQGLYAGYYDPELCVRHYVPASRLTRRYFRKWFYWSGKTHALMFDALYPELNLAAVPRIGGIPRFTFRQGFEQLLRYAATRRGDPLVALIEELRLLQYVGLFVQCWHLRERAALGARRAAAALAALASAATCAVAEEHAGNVSLTIADGRVSLVARDATVRQILAEWARIGGTQIDNVDAAPSGVLDVRLTDVTEDEAVHVLLRGVNYVAVERPFANAAMRSRIGRILIAPAGRAGAPGQPPSAAAPLAESPVRPIIGLNGLPVPDDQAEAPQARHR
ncbi:MAG TPA: glycosyltransferase [Vicinamibacterales bacterium]|nr:glycosyltransferase [Vicinamibacterales bacterium]